MLKSVGIDFGSTELRVSVPGNGICLREPCVVATHATTKEQKKFGTAAQKWVEESGGQYVLTRPFYNGAFCDTAMAKRVLKWVLHQIYPDAADVRAVLSIPTGFDPDDEMALKELVLSAGYADVALVYSPVAALIGAGCSMEKPYIAVDIGAYSTDVVVLADGELVHRACLDSAAGNSFAESIAAYVAKKYRLRINLRMAEEIKRRIGVLWIDGEKRQMSIAGCNAEGTMCHVLLSSDEMFFAVEEPCAELLDAIHTAVSKVPLDYVKAALENGISLCGGSSRFRG
ncbi:MAG: rod shape-determining protein, partial [Clostridia bacterium]|nr:rod shape-determining protein [Clostridia bacterium]